MSIRPVKRVVQSKPTIEGAGVKLRRAFGFADTQETDPFLLLDDFRNDRPQDYLAGFPWHPHRGIETITYVLAGTVEHGDSLGNRGRLGAGDIQWMTAGRGIMHQEMPQGDAKGRMHGFQLWANLPSALKMTAPRYQDVKASEVPEAVDDDGVRVRVLCGEFWGKKGPVEGVAADPRYLDVFVPAGRRKKLKVETERHAFAYIFEGDGRFAYASKPFGILTEKQVDGEEILVREAVGDRSLVLFDPGDEIDVQAGERGIRFLLVSGKPIEQPVAWYGPIVMNTRAELEQAVNELRNGTFIKS
jgi:redox-sensitive bicupin YhaK (pirin superfamily)